MTQDSLRLAATLLKLAKEEFGEGKVKDEPENISWLAALLDEWSLMDRGRIKMEPGLDGLWLATQALKEVCGIDIRVEDKKRRTKASLHGEVVVWLRSIEIAECLSIVEDDLPFCPSQARITAVPGQHPRDGARGNKLTIDP